MCYVAADKTGIIGYYDNTQIAFEYCTDASAGTPSWGNKTTVYTGVHDPMAWAWCPNLSDDSIDVAYMTLGGAGDLKYVKLTKSGHTWTLGTPVTIYSPGAGSNNSPACPVSLCRDKFGNLWCAWETNIFGSAFAEVSYSSNGGTTWTRDIIDLSAIIQDGQFSFLIATVDKYVVLLYADQGNSSALHWRRKDATVLGNSWGAEQTRSSSSTFRNTILCAAPDGTPKLHVIASDDNGANDNANVPDFVYDPSTDTFASPVTLDGVSSLNSNASIGGDGTNCWAAWCHNRTTIQYKMFTNGTGWDASPTVLETAGGAGSRNGTNVPALISTAGFLIGWTNGTSNPWSIEEDFVAGSGGGTTINISALVGGLSASRSQIGESITPSARVPGFAKAFSLIGETIAPSLRAPGISSLRSSIGETINPSARVPGATISQSSIGASITPSARVGGISSQKSGNLNASATFSAIIPGNAGTRSGPLNASATISALARGLASQQSTAGESISVNARAAGNAGDLASFLLTTQLLITAILRGVGASSSGKANITINPSSLGLGSSLFGVGPLNAKATLNAIVQGRFGTSTGPLNASIGISANAPGRATSSVAALETTVELITALLAGQSAANITIGETLSVTARIPGTSGVSAGPLRGLLSVSALGYGSTLDTAVIAGGSIELITALATGIGAVAASSFLTTLRVIQALGYGSSVAKSGTLLSKINLAPQLTGYTATHVGPLSSAITVNARTSGSSLDTALAFAGLIKFIQAVTQGRGSGMTTAELSLLFRDIRIMLGMAESGWDIGKALSGWGIGTLE